MAFIVGIDRRRGQTSFRMRIGHIFEIGLLIQLAAWAWNHFPTKRNHLRVQLLEAIPSQIEERSQ